jgi:hypothetical protein
MQFVYVLHTPPLSQQNGEGSETQIAYVYQLRNLAIETFPGRVYSRLFAAQSRAFLQFMEFLLVHRLQPCLCLAGC